MTHIEQMIQDMCPNGVEFKKLGDLGVFENTGVDKKSHDDEQEVTLLNFMDVCRHKYIDASIPSMVVTAPDRKIEQCNVLKDDIFITPSSETIDEIGFAAVIMEDLPNVVYSYHIMRYRLKQPNTTTAKFIRYLFEAPVIRKQILKGAKGLTRFGLSKYQFADIEIPLPPLEIQKKIVECLDKFSALAAELQAELQMRRKQYEYYRTQLLTPHSDCNSADNTDDRNWEWKYLVDVATVQYGYPFEAEKFTDDESYIPLIRIRDVMPAQASTYYEGTYPPEYIVKKGDILVGMDGNFNLEKWNERDGLLNQRVCKISTKDNNIILNDYLYHYLRPEFKKIENEIKGGTVKHLSAARIKQIMIPVPPINEQCKIAEALNLFSKIIQDMEEGIPAEQIRQQKRYEYFRDLLLTFDRKAV